MNSCGFIEPLAIAANPNDNVLSGTLICRAVKFSVLVMELGGV